MSKAALHSTRLQVNAWFVIQAMVTTTATLLAIMIAGFAFAESLLLGGLLCFVPQWLFARLWLSYYKASAARKLVTMFYIGEVMKMCLTALLFIVALIYLPINLLACLMGFGIAQVAFWLAPLVMTLKKTQR